MLPISLLCSHAISSVCTDDGSPLQGFACPTKEQEEEGWSRRVSRREGEWEAQKYNWHLKILLAQNNILARAAIYSHNHLAAKVKAWWCGGGGARDSWAEIAMLSICAQTGFLQPFLTLPARQNKALQV